ncbi:uncharacterized protein LOC141853072 [Brevipalpus obovatus]|uniref:uncharacterized protein LOC141853072 n=1 Tax=Brevipalpus obovatus TaxID=246614 RepID=UPI003D9DDC3C
MMKRHMGHFSVSMTWCIFMWCLICECLSSGIFEVEIVEFEHKNFYSNDDHRLIYSMCLKESNTYTHGAPCTYGNISSPLVPISTAVNLKLPFTFRWMKSFTLIVSVAMHSKSSDFIVPLEKQIHLDDNVLPTNRSSDSPRSWLYKTFKTPRSHLVYRYRIYCDLYYYGDECSEFCRERNDIFGHYTCLNSGQKQCLHGWKGDNCEKPICRSGCSLEHGYCSEPDQCQCRPGYSGPLCNQCLLYPGCVHGYCLKPWQCLCYRNWGGILCDQDLNYCGTHQPCLNGGLCGNIAPNQYKCHCKPGYEGNNCQIVVNPCATTPCLHGGTCFEMNNSSFACDCSPGWIGTRCEINVNECSSNPCLNDGKCIDLINGYQCICPPGFTGERCQDDIDECRLGHSLTPCISSTTESCENQMGSFKCNCVKGFSGVHCEHNVDDCDPNPCANEGTCIDLINGYQCICQRGFKGSNCQQMDENICSSNSHHDDYWEVVSRSSNCPMKWCKCSKNQGPFCVCAAPKSRALSLESANSFNQMNSLMLVFEQSLTKNQTQIICEALRALLILYQDSFESNKFETSCKQEDHFSIIFSSLDYSDSVWKIGDILMNSRNSFHIKEIIKNHQEDLDGIKNHFSQMLSTLTMLLFMCFTIIGSYFFRKYLLNQAQQIISFRRKNSVENRNNLDIDQHTSRPMSINILSQSPILYKSKNLDDYPHLYLSENLHTSPSLCKANLYSPGPLSSKYNLSNSSISSANSIIYEHTIKCKEKEFKISNEQIV